MKMFVNEPENVKLTLDQKQKESIYKCIEVNKDIYLIKQHHCFKKKKEHPEKAAALTTSKKQLL